MTSATVQNARTRIIETYAVRRVPVVVLHKFSKDSQSAANGQYIFYNILLVLVQVPSS